MNIQERLIGGYGSQKKRFEQGEKVEKSCAHYVAAWAYGVEVILDLTIIQQKKAKMLIINFEWGQACEEDVTRGRNKM